VKIAKYCNIWRNYNDISDSWDSVNDIINFFGDDKTNFTAVAAPGSFNDPDMVCISIIFFLLVLLVYSPNSTWLDSTQLDTFDFVEQVEMSVSSETSRAVPTWRMTNKLVQV